MKTVFKIKNEKDTKKIAEELANNLDRNIICLYGELGVGKTTFTKYFAKALGVESKIISPTFVLIRKHKAADSDFYHIDAYRISDLNKEKFALEEIINEKNAIIIIEWADKISEILPKKRIDIYFKLINDEREVEIIKQG